jgi:DNA invertase Pin-like site-specific DNA recombinase
VARTFFPAVPSNTASINIRLSKEAREENLSRDGMVADCEALCARMGLRVTATHIDDGISGSVRNRPGFVAWLDDAREGRCDHLVAWHVDRMTREGVNVAGLILDAIEGKDPETGKQVRQKVRLLDTKGLDSDPGPGGDDSAFRFKFIIAAEIARAERERMRDRNRAAYRRATAAGRWSGGPPPYGFQAVDNPDGPGVVLVHQPEEVAFIREAADRILTGQNISQVTRWANLQSGMKPRKADTWNRRSLGHILNGFPIQGKIVAIVEGKPVPVVDETGTPVTLEPILDADTSAALRQRLAVKDPNAAKAGRKPSRLLSGIVQCSGCRSRMTVSRRGNGHINYRCPEGATDGLCKRPVSISAPLLEEFIEADFLRSYGDSPEYVKRAQVAGAAVIDEAQEAKTAALNALSAAPTAENLQQLQEADAALAEAIAMPRETRVTLVPTGRTVAEAWAASPMEERRDMLAANYVSIMVGPGQRGKRSIDPSRLTIISQPTVALGHQDEDWTPGKMVM